MAKKKSVKKAAPAKRKKKAAPKPAAKKPAAKKPTAKKPAVRNGAKKKPVRRTGSKAGQATPPTRASLAKIDPPVSDSLRFNDGDLYRFVATVPYEPDTSQTSFEPTVYDVPYGTFTIKSQKTRRVISGWELEIFVIHSHSSAAKRGTGKRSLRPLASGKLTITIKSNIRPVVLITTFEYKTVIYALRKPVGRTFGLNTSGKLTVTTR